MIRPPSTACLAIRLAVHRMSRNAPIRALCLWLLVVTACPKDDPQPTLNSAPSAAIPTPSSDLLRPKLELAASAALRLLGPTRSGQLARREGPPAMREVYLTIRRECASAAPFVRRRAEIGSEVLYGPLRSADEAGGALALLDIALDEPDPATAQQESVRQLEQVRRAAGLIAQELSVNPLSEADVVRALSAAAYDLGLMLLEANPGVALEPDAVRADLLGHLQGMDAMARAVAASEGGRADRALKIFIGRLAPFRQTVSAASDAHAMTGRAELVRLTGELGVAARRLGSALGYEVGLPYLARVPVAKNMLAEPVHAFTVPAPRRDRRAAQRPALAELGEALFFDKRLSRGGARSCAGCHVPANAFSDSIAVPRSLTEKPIERNAPSLLYTSLHAAQFWDGRFADPERQALRVIQTPEEMGLTLEELEEVLRSDAAYQRRFGELFADGVKAPNVARALVAFEVEKLVPADAPIDRFARGAPLSPAIARGLDVFVGVARCARCHVPPLFGGSRPTDFAVPIFAALGVPSKVNGKELDSDEGRGGVSHRPLDKHAFKTPTLRNIDRTAPYFHHGRFPTLDDVVDFYDKGGGAAFGVELSNQDPDVRELELAKEQRRALITFMRDGLRDETMPFARRR